MPPKRTVMCLFPEGGVEATDFVTADGDAEVWRKPFVAISVQHVLRGFPCMLHVVYHVTYCVQHSYESGGRGRNGWRKT